MLISKYVCAWMFIFWTDQSYYYNEYPDIPLRTEWTRQKKKNSNTFSNESFFAFNESSAIRWTVRLWVPIEFTRLNYEHRHMKTLTPKWYSYGRIYLYKSMTSVELCVFSVSKTFAAIQLYIAFVLSNMLCSLSILNKRMKHAQSSTILWTAIVFTAQTWDQWKLISYEYFGWKSSKITFF